jgi:hypothetical protein
MVIARHLIANSVVNLNQCGSEVNPGPTNDDPKTTVAIHLQENKF